MRALRLNLYSKQMFRMLLKNRAIGLEGNWTVFKLYIFQTLTGVCCCSRAQSMTQHDDRTIRLKQSINAIQCWSSRYDLSNDFGA